MAIIGIDLGTTNSTCSVWRDNKVELIPNRLGEFLTPSVVGLDEKKQISVGRVAKEHLISHSDRTVAVFKRLMGTDHKVNIGGKQFTAVELSSLVLQTLKEDAEKHLGEVVEEAVISVPAYFNDNQRHATKLAGELAGFKVERLINEPTAAAMAYGLHDKQEGTFLILDMGGGTFDVSILEFFEGIMEVHASAGDNFLGGEDFVDAMVESVLEELSIDKTSLSRLQQQQLQMKMETVKRRVGTHGTQELTFSCGDKQIEWAATEEWFVRVVTPLLLRVKRPIEQALRDADMTPKEIDEVVLVGGSTKLSVFRSLVSRMFGRLPSCHLDPDCVVAMGAAIQAGLKSRDEALEDVILTDVCPYTLGTEVNGPEEGANGGYFLPIIERNSIVPISVARGVVTSVDNQKQLEINVFQGENRLVEKNIFLGKLTVNVPKGKAGKEGADIRYSYDVNGLLEVDVTVVSTGKVHSMVIENTPGALSQKDIEKTRKKLAELKFHPREQEENRALLAKGERMYESSLSERRDYISNLLANFDKVLERQNPREIVKSRQDLDSVLSEMDEEEWF